MDWDDIKIWAQLMGCILVAFTILTVGATGVCVILTEILRAI